MRHSYYNEWLVNKVPSGYGGDHGHADPINEAVKSYAPWGTSAQVPLRPGVPVPHRCEGSDRHQRSWPTYPTPSEVASADPGISCQVCHTGHVGMGEHGGYDSMRRWGNGKEVSCGDCHNWQFEMLDQALQYETIAGVEYTRPAANSVSRHPQREMVTGGRGGEDGMGGLWGVAPMGTAMPDTECKDCHMPRTHKEGMPADDDRHPGSGPACRTGSASSSPAEAKRWKLRPNGDSCALDCHKEEAAEYSRDDMQNWIDDKRAAVASAQRCRYGRTGCGRCRSRPDRLEQLLHCSAGRRRGWRADICSLGDAAARCAERRLRPRRQVRRRPQPRRTRSRVFGRPGCGPGPLTPLSTPPLVPVRRSAAV